MKSPSIDSHVMGVYADFILRIAQEEGVRVGPGMRLLDFGCGAGVLVRHFLDKGLDAYGADLDEFWIHGDNSDPEPNFHEERHRFRRIESSPYRIPFDDNSFDFCCSTQVFEHVRDYDQALGEIHRVLKPGGAALHLFPSRWRIVESHVFVPFASVLRARPYLAFWALLGIRNRFQKGMPWREVAKVNEEYLRSSTLYLSRRQIARIARGRIGEVRFLHRAYVKHHPSRKMRWLGKVPIPGWTGVLSNLSEQALWHRKSA